MPVMGNPALDASEVVQVYNAFNDIHEEALNPRTSRARYEQILDQMEKAVLTLKRHVVGWSGTT